MKQKGFPSLSAVTYKLYHFHYDGIFASLFDAFETRTRLPRESIIFAVFSLTTLLFSTAILWRDVETMALLGFSVAAGIPLMMANNSTLQKTEKSPNTRLVSLNINTNHWSSKQSVNINHWPSKESLSESPRRQGTVTNVPKAKGTDRKSLTAPTQLKKGYYVKLNSQELRWNSEKTPISKEPTIVDGYYKHASGDDSQSRRTTANNDGGKIDKDNRWVQQTEQGAELSEFNFDVSVGLENHGSKSTDRKNGGLTSDDKGSLGKGPRARGEQFYRQRFACQQAETEMRQWELSRKKDAAASRRGKVLDGSRSRKRIDYRMLFRNRSRNLNDESVEVTDETNYPTNDHNNNFQLVCNEASQTLQFLGESEEEGRTSTQEEDVKQEDIHNKTEGRANRCSLRSERNYPRQNFGIALGDLLVQQARCNVSNNAGHSNQKSSALMAEAMEFIDVFFKHEGMLGSPQHQARVKEVEAGIVNKGFYEHSRQELIFGVRKAFRETATCLGRKDWESLQIFDCRHIHGRREIFNACCNHIRYATNGGRIRPTISVFRQTKPTGERVRIWNERLVAYAGYKTLNGTVTGDPSTTFISKLCRHMGWKPKVTNWDVLPLLIQIDGSDPQLFTIPHDLLKTVIIRHPRYCKLETLNLRWYALPSTANMGLVIGGIEYGAAPFSGIHVASSIARGPLNEESRYNYSGEVGKAMDLDVLTDPSNWREKAINALEEAILYSFQTQQVTILNDANVAELVEGFIKENDKTSLVCSLDLSSRTGEALESIVSPIVIEKCLRSKMQSVALNTRTAKFHHHEISEVHKYIWSRFRKNAATQQIPTRVNGIWHRRGRIRAIAWACRFFSRLMGHVTRHRFQNAHILYTRLNGLSHRHANILRAMLMNYFRIKVMQASEFDTSKLMYEDLLIIIIESGCIWNWARNFIETSQRKAKMKNLRFAIIALDSSASPEFGNNADRISKALREAGANEILPAHKADDLNGQDTALQLWSRKVAKVLLKTSGNIEDLDYLLSVRKLRALEKWKIQPDQQNWRAKTPEIICKELGRIHNANILQFRVPKNLEVNRKDKSHKTLVTDFVDNFGEALNFSPGDDLGIIPQNHPKFVQLVLSRLQSPSPLPDQPLSIEVLDLEERSYGVRKIWNICTRLPSQLTLREALTYYLDITTPPSQDILSDLAELTSDAREKTLLTALARDDNTYDRWRVKKSMTLPGLLTLFPYMRVNAEILLKKSPTLQPRLYAIASSPAEDKIRITTAIVKEKAPHSNASYGVCSNWIASHDENCLVYGFIKSSESFHLPSDASLPVVMVGTGVSIAPFRSFWNERIKCRLLFPHRPEEETSWGKWGKLVLYMGCRSADEGEIIFDREIKTVIEKKHVKAKFALSREGEKEYVSDLLRKDAKNIFKDVVKKGGHIYLSGDENMIHSCKQEILEILRMEGNMNLETASKYLERLQLQGRLHEKNFGLSLHRDEILNKALAQKQSEKQTEFNANENKTKSTRRNRD